MECVPVQRCNDTLLSIVGQLDEESKQVLLARAQQVFEEAQRMRGGVVQYGGTVSDTRLSMSVFREDTSPRNSATKSSPSSKN